MITIIARSVFALPSRKSRNQLRCNALHKYKTDPIESKHRDAVIKLQVLYHVFFFCARNVWQICENNSFLYWPTADNPHSWRKNDHDGFGSVVAR